jgi:hypothetical protein
MIILPIDEVSRMIQGKSSYTRIGFRKIEHSGHINLLNRYLEDTPSDRRIVAVSSYFCEVAYCAPGGTNDAFLLQYLKSIDCIVTNSKMTLDIAKQAFVFTKKYKTQFDRIVSNYKLTPTIANEAIGMLIKDGIEKESEVIIGSRLIIPYMLAKVFASSDFVDNYVPIFGSYRDEDNILYSTTSCIPDLSIKLMDIEKCIQEGKSSIQDFKYAVPEYDILILDMSDMLPRNEITSNCFVILSRYGWYDYLTIRNNEILL